MLTDLRRQPERLQDPGRIHGVHRAVVRHPRARAHVGDEGPPHVVVHVPPRAPVAARHLDLQREVRREHRGAMRALRKDNAFMAGVRNREEARTKQATQKQYNHVFQFLQQQEQDFRSGGQKGIIFNKKKK